MLTPRARSRYVDSEIEEILADVDACSTSAELLALLARVRECHAAVRRFGARVDALVKGD